MNLKNKTNFRIAGSACRDGDRKSPVHDPTVLLHCRLPWLSSPMIDSGARNCSETRVLASNHEETNMEKDVSKHLILGATDAKVPLGQGKGK